MLLISLLLIATLLTLFGASYLLRATQASWLSEKYPITYYFDLIKDAKHSTDKSFSGRQRHALAQVDYDKWRAIFSSDRFWQVVNISIFSTIASVFLVGAIGMIGEYAFVWQWYNDIFSWMWGYVVLFALTYFIDMQQGLFYFSQISNEINSKNKNQHYISNAGSRY